MDSDHAAAVDHVAVDRLQRAYADGITRRDWDAVADLFLPGAVVSLDLVTRPGRELVGPNEIVGFIGPAVDDFDFFGFFERVWNRPANPDSFVEVHNALVPSVV